MLLFLRFTADYTTPLARCLADFASAGLIVIAGMLGALLSQARDYSVTPELITRYSSVLRIIAVPISTGNYLSALPVHGHRGCNLSLGTYQPRIVILGSQLCTSVAGDLLV